jgi:hypothetical protein
MSLTNLAYCNVSYEQERVDENCPCCGYESLTIPIISNAIISPTPSCPDCGEISDEELIIVSFNHHEHGTVFWIKDIWCSTDADPKPLYDFYLNVINNSI